MTIFRSGKGEIPPTLPVSINPCEIGPAQNPPMNSAMSTAVSGMSAAWSRLTATAADVIQLATGGPLPAAAQGKPAAPVSGGVSPVAGSQIAVTNSVDQINDVANEITATLAYKANLKSFEAASKMMKSTLDLIA